MQNSQQIPLISQPATGTVKLCLTILRSLFGPLELTEHSVNVFDLEVQISVPQLNVKRI